MADPVPPNPYHHDYGDDVAAAPFAGRADAFARLYRHLARSDRVNAMCILGQRHIGKTALLHAARAVFADSHLGVYVSLRENPVDDLTDWVLLLAQSATAALIERGYTVHRLSALQPPAENPFDWFTTTFLPALIGALRNTRRLLWLIDDGHEALAAVRMGKLPANLFAHMHAMIAEVAPIDMVIALDAAYEDDLPEFAPLLQSIDVIRLSHLLPADSAWVLNEPVRDLYEVPEETVTAVHAAAGGAPGLIQQFGYLMFRKWSINRVHTEMTPADVRAMIATVYAYGERDFVELWRGLTAEERLVLTAVSSMTYVDPLAAITASRIEAWLIETDFPLDLVAIHAALRGLDYRHAITTGADGVRVNGEILQLWLIEHARLGSRMAGDGNRLQQREQDRRARVDVALRLANRGRPNPVANRRNSNRLIIAFGLALLISLGVLMASALNTPPPLPNAPQAPTATLILNTPPAPNG
ncbi:MAG: hypothetical protein SF162_10815 [bacterium]|nr:hypothetical protein [bacterium]